MMRSSQSTTTLPGRRFRRSSPGPGIAPAPDLLTALQLQLGLKLELEKAPSEVIVIDHMDKKPTGN
jgi:uncharacterized protein (TIGR03435 family)